MTFPHHVDFTPELGLELKSHEEQLCCLFLMVFVDAFQNFMLSSHLFHHSSFFPSFLPPSLPSLLLEYLLSIYFILGLLLEIHYHSMTQKLLVEN